MAISLWQKSNLQCTSNINWNVCSKLPVLIIFIFTDWALLLIFGICITFKSYELFLTHLILFLYFSPFWFIHVLLVQFCQGRVFPTSSYTVFRQDKDGSGQNKYCKSWGRHKNNIQDAADGSCRKFRDVVIALKLLWINCQIICVWMK